MSRYECSTVEDTAVAVLSGREAREQGVLNAGEARAGEHALVLGDCYATAFAVTGTTAQLRGFLAKCSARLDAAALAAGEAAPSSSPGDISPEPDPPMDDLPAAESFGDHVLAGGNPADYPRRVRGPGVARGAEAPNYPPL